MLKFYWQESLVDENILFTFVAETRPGSLAE